MPAFLNGQQHQKVHATTTIASVAVQANRFIAYDGSHATSAGGVLKDCQGVSETAAVANDPISVVTGYSYLVECSEAINFGDYIQPATDGSGRAARGTLASHCGRALGVTTAAGQLVECQIVRHAHP